MNTIDKIREILNLSKQTPNTKLYKEEKLDDGRVIATDGDDFTQNEKVYILNDNGEASKVEKGTYTFADGRKINVDENSTLIGFQEEEEEGVDADEKRADERGDKETTIKDEVAGIIANELPDMDNDKIQDIAEKIAKVVEGEDIVVEPEKEAEEMSEEKEEEVKEEETQDFKNQYFEALSEISNKIDAIETRLKEVENEPASNGVVHNPLPNKENLSKNIDIKGLTAQGRALYMLKNNLNN